MAAPCGAGPDGAMTSRLKSLSAPILAALRCEVSGQDLVKSSSRSEARPVGWCACMQRPPPEEARGGGCASTTALSRASSSCARTRRLTVLRLRSATSRRSHAWGPAPRGPLGALRRRASLSSGLAAALCQLGSPPSSGPSSTPWSSTARCSGPPPRRWACPRRRCAPRAAPPPAWPMRRRQAGVQTPCVCTAATARTSSWRPRRPAPRSTTWPSSTSLTGPGRLRRPLPAMASAGRSARSPRAPWRTWSARFPCGRRRTSTTPRRQGSSSEPGGGALAPVPASGASECPKGRTLFRP
mmetsp:Transcript_22980/g.47695  ORF Transcript_22980/g.47695 Transcript_22980/m.47695 type:complete len:298 (+) Transcript_22980:168-1061(+)